MDPTRSGPIIPWPKTEKRAAMVAVWCNPIVVQLKINVTEDDCVEVAAENLIIIIVW
jgi:hypothetical protein